MMATLRGRRVKLGQIFGVLVIGLALMGSVLGPVFQPTPTAHAQGIFGCPLPSQQDCDLLLSAVDNMRALESVHVDEIGLQALIMADGRPTSIELSASGPTHLHPNGDVANLEWRVEPRVGGGTLPFVLRVVDGIVYLDVEPNNPNNDWLGYDGTAVGTGQPDLTGVFNTLNFGNLIGILNEVSDGVEWTVQPDTRLNGQDMAVFEARFSVASLVRTTYAYRQLELLLGILAQQLGFRQVDQNLVEFALDFIITGLSQQLGGTDFAITWLIGRDDQQIHRLDLRGAARIDLLFLSFLVNDVGLLPEEVQFNLQLSVALNEHNAAPTVTAPENVTMVDPALIQRLLDELLAEWFGDVFNNVG